MQSLVGGLIRARGQHALFKGLKKILGAGYGLWYYVDAFDALVSPLEREESGREVTLAAFFYVRPKTARLCEGLGKAPDSSI